MIARRVIVTGRVQGVGFRETMVARARSAGVVGWVRNRADGTVEAHVQGGPEAVERVLGWCRIGPSAAKVTRVEVCDAAPEADCSDFSRRPSLY